MSRLSVADMIRAQELEWYIRENPHYRAWALQRRLGLSSSKFFLLIRHLSAKTYSDGSRLITGIRMGQASRGYYYSMQAIDHKDMGNRVFETLGALARPRYGYLEALAPEVARQLKEILPTP